MRTHTPQIRRKHHNIVLEIPNASLFPSFPLRPFSTFPSFPSYLFSFFFFSTLKTFSSFSSLSIPLASRETFPNIFYIVFHYSLFLFFLCWHTNFVSFFRPTPIVNMLPSLSLSPLSRCLLCIHAILYFASQFQVGERKMTLVDFVYFLYLFKA